ncbi:aminotransferase class V-fold PLP-dependent enzyme [Candidatus Bathyarchaeota archaeon]|nr:aminotransferase class V-fold PLP-dependent enzyme [Candidatus Bathyarchaeota archaeon]
MDLSPLVATSLESSVGNSAGIMAPGMLPGKSHGTCGRDSSTSRKKTRHFSLGCGRSSLGLYATGTSIYSMEMVVDTNMKLYTPGPVHVAPDTLAVMSKHCDTHRSSWYSDMHEHCENLLQELMFTENQILLGAFTGTGFMEACVTNLLGKDDTGLFVSVGAFGKRWTSIARGHGKEFDILEFEMGKAAKADKIKEILERKEYATVFIQFNETSTGIRNPLEEIAPVVKDSGALLCVDAVSGLGGMKLEVDELGIDVCLASTQKCLAVPPGIALCSISEHALEKSKTVGNRGYYLDFMVLMKKAPKHQTPTTIAVPLVRALEYKLGKIIEEGVEQVFDRHSKMAEMTWKWANDAGFEIFPEEGHRSSTVSTIANNRNIDVAKFVKVLLDKGYRIVNGYGDLKGKTFRIGHMGDLQPDDMEELFGVMDETLVEI